MGFELRWVDETQELDAELAGGAFALGAEFVVLARGEVVLDSGIGDDDGAFAKDHQGGHHAAQGVTVVADHDGGLPRERDG